MKLRKDDAKIRKVLDKLFQRSNIEKLRELQKTGKVTIDGETWRRVPVDPVHEIRY